MQTILGAGGAIGIPLARELKNYTDQIRLVSRNPKKVNSTDELFSVDLSDLSQVEKAIAGSKFEKHFGTTATAPEDGIKIMIESLKSSTPANR